MVADAAIQITDVVGLSSFCYYAAAVVATAQAFSVAVDAVTMDAILSSGSFSFSAAVAMAVVSVLPATAVDVAAAADSLLIY